MLYGEKVIIERVDKFLKRHSYCYYGERSPLSTSFIAGDEQIPFGDLGKRKWRPIQPGECWGSKWTSAWFHFSGGVPSHWRGSEVVAVIDTGGEGCVFDRAGNPLCGLTSESAEIGPLFRKAMVPIVDKVKGGETVEFLVEAAANKLLGVQGEVKLKAGELVVFRRDLWHLFHDLTFLFDLAISLPGCELRRARILRALDQALNDYANGGEAEVVRASNTLKAHLDKKNGDVVFEVSAIGHAHLDLVWLWPLRETIRKGGRTFSSSLRMMEEYPEYKFAASQPQLYQLVKEHYPELFERVKKAVRANRWEPLGAMWVEPDCNIPSGESLVRQIYFGKRFYKEEFGVDVDNLWLPDTFGFSPVLPQLMRKSGVKYFMSQKMSWSKTNTFPHHTFEWVGIDGSRVFSHFLPSNTMNSKLLPAELLFGASNFRQKDRCNHWLFSFGEGDGGGGPGRHHLEFARRARDCAGVPRVTQRFVRDFFRLAEQEAKDLPRWHGELYLERHRGTLTTCGKTKLYNRRIEILLHDLELLLLLNHFLLQKEYPSAKLEALWKTLLLQQFHDILPGTTIHMAFEESNRCFEELISESEASIRQALKTLFLGLYRKERITPGLILMNTTGFSRRQICRLPLAVVSQGEQLIADCGEPVAVQRGEEEIFLECDLPAYGFVHLQRKVSNLESAEIPPMRISDKRMENSLLRLEFSNSGHLERIFDKQEQREVIAEKDQANELLLFRDVPVGYDAWDIDPYYSEEQPERTLLVSSRVKEKGPLCVCLEQNRRISKSRITQEIRLYKDSKLIEFNTRVEWREDQRLLKTRFPLNIHSPYAQFDVQFGNISRPTFKNTTWEQVQYEVFAHKWVDLAESGYGIALLNDCKYGHNAYNNVVELTLLRSPVDPDPLRDRGIHTFTYALYPHRGDFRDGGVIPISYFLNYPILHLGTDGATEVESRVASLESKSLFSLDTANVVLETVKRAELDEAIVIRFYESFGRRGQVRVQTPFAVKQARETDLLENDLSDLPVNRDNQGSTVIFSIRPYEIKTVKLWVEAGKRIVSAT